jgi:hypothetical protein
MRWSTALRLARPSAAAERGRSALIAGSVAAAGALLLAAVHIARLPTSIYAGDLPEQHLASYVTEDGLRPGVVTAALLLAVPVLALTVQALRVGSVARDRRMAALRLAGATPRDVRTIAGIEAGFAALAGGLLAGPAYLLLWLLVGKLPPDSARMLDEPDALDALAWAALVPLAALAGAVSGAAIHGRAVVEPLGVRHRVLPARPGRVSRSVLIAGIVLIGVGVGGAASGDAAHTTVLALLLTMMLGLLLAAFAGGSRLVLARARALAQRPGIEALLASRRLQADPHSAGRVAGVLFLCGVALSIDVVLVVEQLATSGFGASDHFYLVGFAMTALAVVVSAGVALLTLLVGAADGLLDARRPLAALAAQGVDEQFLARVLARQLSATAAPAAVAGALVGGPAIALFVGLDDGGWTALEALAGSLAGALVAGPLLALAARAAARLLRPLVRAAIDPENLRAA